MSHALARILPVRKPRPEPETGGDWLDDIRARESGEVARTRLAAVGFAVLSAVLGASLAAVVLIRPPLPVYVLAMDPVTGAPGTLTQVNELTLTADATRDRYWLRQFVLAREGYNAHTIARAEYRTVSLLAASDVAAGYERDVLAFEAEHVGRLADVQVDVEVGPIIVAEGGGVATVRFTRALTNRSGSSGDPPVERRIATIAYDYRPHVAMTMRDRVENPLAFRVTSYRVEEDYSS